MGVLIGIACSSQGRVSAFHTYLDALRRPEGSVVKYDSFPSIAKARNNLCEAALEGGHSHLFFLDDDHAFAPGTLEWLLACNLPIVSGLYLQRKYPWPACAYGYWEGGKAMPLLLEDGMEGLRKVAAVGAGCLLISTEVLKAMPKPWFTLESANEKDLISEDFNFCRAAQAAGFDVVVDLDIVVGHFSTLPLLPWRTPKGEWATCLDDPRGRVYFPPSHKLMLKKAADKREAALAAKEKKDGQ